ncbi:hypothetical protein HB825_15790 [Listeria booriae]|uniref:Uncharacterized protein n=1 Tax=Listeria booriae TaxID=1552123 RepID=A0A7X0XC58_9LIST|nr:hypothetical protein [Listeria booriae]MBC1491498.1 hypothetical protein [Listeria booriae]MBC1505062.1 hypothetical protein [Listeria booriae]MBC1531580.1 hypothetical protein [Listeria booriae]MBC6136300.1 hypothetical protein [Listeria booriae]
MRKIIYIGEADGYTIYFDTKKKYLLKSKKSRWLNNEKTRNNSKYIIFVLVILLLISSLVAFFAKDQLFSSKYTSGILIILAIIWVFEFLFLTIVTDRILYRNVKKAKSATKRELGKAIRNNNIWNIFNNKKVTFMKKLFAWMLTLVVVCATIGFIISLYLANEQGYFIGFPIGSEIIALSLFGVLPYLTAVLIWENNLIRWFTVVEKYQNKKMEGK